MTFTPGMSTTNTFTSTADPELRKFIIYVPTNYQPQNGPYPVVYMLHGSSQTAQIPLVVGGPRALSYIRAMSHRVAFQFRACEARTS